MTTPAPFPYEGPAQHQAPLIAALHQVVDPEVAMSIVDVGLVYGLRLDDERAHLRLTMTSAACPVIDVIVDEAILELEKVLPPQIQVEVELVWEPPWTPERMSARAKAFMGW